MSIIHFWWLGIQNAFFFLTIILLVILFKSLVSFMCTSFMHTFVGNIRETCSAIFTYMRLKAKVNVCVIFQFWLGYETFVTNLTHKRFQMIWCVYCHDMTVHFICINELSTLSTRYGSFVSFMLVLNVLIQMSLVSANHTTLVARLWVCLSMNLKKKDCYSKTFWYEIFKNEIISETRITICRNQTNYLQSWCDHPSSQKICHSPDKYFLEVFHYNGVCVLWVGFRYQTLHCRTHILILRVSWFSYVQQFLV